jgi:hypothetical protein
MRLTVGPLPAGVYWRRRLVVLLAIVLVVSVVVFSCQGGADPGATTGAGATTSVTPSVAGEPSASEAVESASSSPSQSPSATEFTLPVNGATGPCADTELEVTVLTSAVDYSQGSLIVFTLKIKNISSRTCSRDIGGAAQEIQLREHGTDKVVWSSDDCGGDTTTHWNQTFAPGFQRTFDRNWNGYRSRTDSGPTCANTDGTRLQVGLTYDLVGRLDQKLSAPVEIKISSSKA